MEENNQNNQMQHHSDDNAQLPAVSNNMEFGDEIRKLLPTAGTLVITDQQADILFAPVMPNEILIKPDGLIYLTWTKYAGRLSRAFGVSWTMLPQGMPKVFNKLVVWGFHLIIKGVYHGFAIGEQEYHDNKRMTWGEACEGARSNALTRLCKAMGMCLELWDKAFIKDWLDKYTQKVWDAQANDNRGRYNWSLKPNAFAGLPELTQLPRARQNEQIIQPVQQTVQNTAQPDQNPAQNQNTVQPVVTPVVQAPVQNTAQPIVQAPAQNQNPVQNTVQPNAKANVSQPVQNTVQPAAKVQNPVQQSVKNQEQTKKPDSEEFVASVLKKINEATNDNLHTIYNDDVVKSKHEGVISKEQAESLRIASNERFFVLNPDKRPGATTGATTNDQKQTKPATETIATSKNTKSAVATEKKADKKTAGTVEKNTAGSKKEKVTPTGKENSKLAENTDFLSQSKENQSGAYKQEAHKQLGKEKTHVANTAKQEVKSAPVKQAVVKRSDFTHQVAVEEVKQEAPVDMGNLPENVRMFLIQIEEAKTTPQLNKIIKGDVKAACLANEISKEHKIIITKASNSKFVTLAEDKK